MTYWLAQPKKQVQAEDEDSTIDFFASRFLYLSLRAPDFSDGHGHRTAALGLSLSGIGLPSRHREFNNTWREQYHTSIRENR